MSRPRLDKSPRPVPRIRHALRESVKQLGRLTLPAPSRPQAWRPSEFMASIDVWREAQPDKPSRSEAIRRLVERGLKAS